MSQLNFYVSDDIEKIIRAEAKSSGESISAYLAELVKSHVKKDRWQKDFFKKVVGAWQGDFPEIESLPIEERNSL